MSSNELQNDEFLLPGNLGTIIVGGIEREIVKTVSDYKNGSLTITIGKPEPTFELIDPKECVFDVKKIEDRMKELGALEDIECEIIPSNSPTNEQ